MNFLLRNPSRLLGLAALGLACALFTRNAMGFGGDTWDPQGTAGGKPTSGSWESASWSTLTTEGAMSPPVNWVEGGAALFAFGNTGGTNTLLTITMDANHTVAGIFNGPLVPASCYVTINGAGTMTMPGTAAQGFDTGGSTLGQTTITVPIAGTAILESEGSGSLFLYGSNTYTGGTLLGGGGGVNFNNGSAFGTGTITWGVAQSVLADPANDGVGGNTGATGPITIPNKVVAISGSQIFVGITAAPVTFSGTWTLPASGTVALDVRPVGFVETISGPISGAAGFTKIGPATLMLSGTNTYSGPTTITNGILALGTNGSISSSSSITFITGSSGGTVFDVSAINAYTLGGSSTLIARGTGTSTATAANIKGASGGSVSLGSRPVILSFTPTAFSGDTAHPSLYVSQGSLKFSNNAITITNAAATALGVGTYRLIQVGNGTSGSITGVPNGTVSVVGAGIAAGTAGILSVSNGNLNLVVKPGPLFSALTKTETNRLGIGVISVTLSGKLSAGSVYPALGETITININGTNCPTTVNDATGDFALTFAPGSILYSTTNYHLTYSYTGDASLAGVTNSATSLLPNVFFVDDALPGFSAGMNLFFTNSAGISMFTWSTTNPALPVTDWTLEGSMAEQPLHDTNNNSRYSINVIPAAPVVYYISGPATAWPFLTPASILIINTDPQTNYTFFTTNVSITVQGVLGFPSAPVIVAQSAASLTVLAGKNAGFDVTTVGSQPITYQWFVNTNTPVSGLQTNSPLVLTNVSTNNSGGYTVLATNQYGSVTSAVEILTVLPQPQLSTQLTGAGFQLSGFAVPGNSYLVQSASNVNPPVVWTTVVTNVTDTNGLAQFTDTNTTANTNVFYRLVFP